VTNRASTCACIRLGQQRSAELDLVRGEQDEDQRVVLALERDGVALMGAEAGRAASEWDCFLSVKHVDRIELTRTAQRATGPTIALARIGRAAT
jgi:hypothetical protein